MPEVWPASGTGGSGGDGGDGGDATGGGIFQGLGSLTLNFTFVGANMVFAGIGGNAGTGTPDGVDGGDGGATDPDIST